VCMCVREFVGVCACICVCVCARAGVIVEAWRYECRCMTCELLCMYVYVSSHMSAFIRVNCCVC